MEIDVEKNDESHQTSNQPIRIYTPKNQGRLTWKYPRLGKGETSTQTTYLVRSSRLFSGMYFIPIVSWLQILPTNTLAVLCQTPRDAPRCSYSWVFQSPNPDRFEKKARQRRTDSGEKRNDTKLRNYSWWLNQPTWKMLDHFPNFRGVN